MRFVKFLLFMCFVFLMVVAMTLHSTKVYVIGIRHLPVVFGGDTEAWALDYAVGGVATNAYFYSKADLLDFVYHLKSLGPMEGRTGILDTFGASPTFIAHPKATKSLPR